MPRQAGLEKLVEGLEKLRQRYRYEINVVSMNMLSRAGQHL